VNSGLAFLLRRGLRGKLRQGLRRMRTVKGAVAMIAAVVFMVGIAALQFWSLSLGAALPAPRGAVVAYAPPMLMLLAVVSAMSGRALYFTPSEVDFLFPAPVGRRELLLYNLLARLDVQLFSALWVSLFLLRHARHWGAAVAATVLGFAFIYVAAQALALAATAADGWVPPRARRPVRWAVLALALAGALAGLAGAGSGATPGQRLRALSETPVLRAASLPARPFAELFAAAGWAQALPWAAASLGVIAAVVVLVLAVDVAYLERSLAVSRRRHERLQRMRSGGGIHAGARPSRLRIRVPRLGGLGGAGALAWRQLTELARTPRALLVPLFVGSLWAGSIFFAARDSGDRSGGLTMILVVTLLLPAMFSGHVTFDFRRDLDRMALLRSLPLSPAQVAAGQVLPVALVFSAMQYLVVVAALALGLVSVGPLLLAVALAIPPYTWATMAVENGLFLLMPYRVVPGEDQRMQFMGKVMLALFLKLIVVGLLVGLALLAGWAAAAATGARAAGLAAGVLVMVGGCIPLTWLVGRAFAAFDVARDTPA
jgi:hypothetical protein